MHAVAVVVVSFGLEGTATGMGCKCAEQKNADDV